VTGAGRDALVRVPWTDHLVTLVGRAEAAAARIRTADPAARATAAEAAARAAARASARLDASPLTDATADSVDRRLAEGRPPVDDAPPVTEPGSGAAGWARALRLDGMETQDVAAVEYAGVLAAAAAEPDLAPAFLERPVETLRRLHALICRGLLDAEFLGRERATDQAVLDGAQGKVLYHLADPAALPGLLARLDAWVRGPSATVHPLAVAGAVHELLLAWGPFEAGNGRVARAAARLVLRGGGLDPDGLAVPETRLLADRTRYHGEVAATGRRRGDLGPWLERAGEAVVAALEEAADRLAPVAMPRPPDRAVDVVAELPAGHGLGLREYAGRAGVTLATARTDLDALRRAGLVDTDAGTRGLRVVVRGGGAAVGVGGGGVRSDEFASR